MRARVIKLYPTSTQSRSYMTIITVVNARNKEHQVTTSRSFVANQTQAIFFVLKIWYKSQITETQKLKKLKKRPPTTHQTSITNS